MTNKEIAALLKLTANLLELHGDNPFKVKSYANASFQVSRYPDSIELIDESQLPSVPGIGKSLAGTIKEILAGDLPEILRNLVAKTPGGVIELLQVKGLGPSKVKTLWNDLGIESPGELMYACMENRLIDVKGFGSKSQADILKVLEFMQQNQGKSLYASIEAGACELLEIIKKEIAPHRVAFTGAMRRKSDILECVDILVGDPNFHLKDECQLLGGLPVVLHRTDETSFDRELFSTSAAKDHLNALTSLEKFSFGGSEEDVYRSVGLNYIPPEMREGFNELDWAKKYAPDELLKDSDIKGVVHSHTRWSDGSNTIAEMSAEARRLGYEYLVITDHSRSAGYANGLAPDRVIAQQNEIAELNKNSTAFKLFSGIESDILGDGSLDYPDDILKSFDVVIASIHSNLNMEPEHATDRIIRAIENPYTDILGHSSGRLLLSRSGYALDYDKVIDACAANGVCIEVNANPRRLDIDWRYIYKCMEKGVMISINPDAHNLEGIQHIRYGVISARKGGLLKRSTLNALPALEFKEWIDKRRAS